MTSKIELAKSIPDIEEITLFFRTLLDFYLVGSIRAMDEVSDILAKQHDFTPTPDEITQLEVHRQEIKQQIGLPDMISSPYLTLQRALSVSPETHDKFNFTEARNLFNDTDPTKRQKYIRFSIPRILVNLNDKTIEQSGENGDLPLYFAVAGRNVTYSGDTLFDCVTNPGAKSPQGEAIYKAKLKNMFAEEGILPYELVLHSYRVAPRNILDISADKLAKNIESEVHQPLLTWNSSHLGGPQGGATGSISITSPRGTTSALWGDQRLAYLNVNSKNQVQIWESPAKTANAYLDNPVITASILAQEGIDVTEQVQEITQMHKQGVTEEGKYNGSGNLSVGNLGVEGGGDFLSCVSTAEFVRPKDSKGYGHAGWTDGFEAYCEIARVSPMSVILFMHWIASLDHQAITTSTDRVSLFHGIPHMLMAHAVQNALNDNLPIDMERRGKRDQISGKLNELKLDDASVFFRVIGNIPIPEFISKEIQKAEEILKSYEYLAKVAHERRDRLVARNS